jgi:hypothetical protein
MAKRSPKNHSCENTNQVYKSDFIYGDIILQVVYNGAGRGASWLSTCFDTSRWLSSGHRLKMSNIHEHKYMCVNPGVLKAENTKQRYHTECYKGSLSKFQNNLSIALVIIVITCHHNVYLCNYTIVFGPIILF